MWHLRTEITHVLAFPRERMIDKGTGRSATQSAPLETGPCIASSSSVFTISTFFLDVADLGRRQPERWLVFFSFSSSFFFCFSLFAPTHVVAPFVRNVTTADDRSRNQPDSSNKCRLGFGRSPTAAQESARRPGQSRGHGVLRWKCASMTRDAISDPVADQGPTMGCINNLLLASHRAWPS